MDWLSPLPILAMLFAALIIAQAWLLDWRLRKALTILAHQLNSNMERQIKAEVDAAVAKEQLRAQMEKG